MNRTTCHFERLVGMEANVLPALRRAGFKDVQFERLIVNEQKL